MHATQSCPDAKRKNKSDKRHVVFILFSELGGLLSNAGVKLSRPVDFQINVFWSFSRLGKVQANIFTISSGAWFPETVLHGFRGPQVKVFERSPGPAGLQALVVEASDHYFCTVGGFQAMQGPTLDRGGVALAADHDFAELLKRAEGAQLQSGLVLGVASDGVAELQG